MRPRQRIRILPLLLIFIGVPVVAIILVTGILNTLDAPLAGAIRSIADDPQLEQTLLAAQIVLAVPLRILFVFLVFTLALIVRRASNRIVQRLFAFQARFVRWLAADSSRAAPQTWDARWSPERRLTVQRTIAGVISFGAFSFAAYLSLSQFLNLGTLAVFATVVSTALGFASRDYIGDLLAGLSNLFEDNLDVGEKVEIERLNNPQQGVVEVVSIRRILLRGPLGNLRIVPHGEIRVLRNFSRGVHSGTRVLVKVEAKDLQRALDLLRTLPPDTAVALPDLLEPWDIQCIDGRLTRFVTLEITAKAPFGRGVALRLEMLTFLERYLHDNGVWLSKS